MTEFDNAVNFVLANENGLVESPDDADPGRITNFGISFRFVREIPEESLKRYGIFEPITDKTIRDLTMAQAKLIYRGEHWDKAPFAKLMNQSLCNYIFDTVVHIGTPGIKLIQRSVWACQKSKDFIKDDGIIGAKTVQAVNYCSFMLLVAMQAQRDAYYRHYVELYPARKGELENWLNRCYRT